MSQTLYLSTINDKIEDFYTLFSLWETFKDVRDLQIDFSDCRFLRQNAVAFLGGIIYNIRNNGGKVSINIGSMSPELLMNLAQNGFLSAVGVNSNPWEGNSIPYRHDTVNKPTLITRYLQEQWIGREWIAVSEKLADTITGTVWEIYANAFEHGKSSSGVFSCGQYFPKLKELNLTVIDFGIGIPASVRGFLDPKKYPEGISADKALEMAFQGGFTTKPKISRGLGLEILKRFIQITGGRMDVYSHEAHGLFSNGDEHFHLTKAFFEGTIVNIMLQCDEECYYILEENSEQPEF